MKTKQWLSNARFTTWWLEFADLGWPDSGLTEKWEARARYFREKGVTGVVLSGFHFRWDYYPVFERVFGLLHEITEICHRHELKVVEHHSSTRVHRVADDCDRRRVRQSYGRHVAFYPDNWEDAVYRGERMADWLQISARTGKPAVSAAECSLAFCPNHPAFAHAYLDYLQRHLAAASVDAVISDDAHFLPDVYSCACSHCRDRFQRDAGLKLPPPSELEFWKNRQNPDFLAWLRLRCDWQAEHYKRIRELLPPEVFLLASANSCVRPDLADIGASPQLAAAHLDAILYEIPPGNQLGADDGEIFSELAGFTSLARSKKKPLLTHCHVHRKDDVGRWLHVLSHRHTRPWISRQMRPDAASEEELLENGYHLERVKKRDSSGSVQALAFSEQFRNSLPPVEAEAYVESYRQLTSALVARDSEPYPIFDDMWTSLSPEQWECLWILDPRSLTEEQARIVEDWQDQGLAVGVA